MSGSSLRLPDFYRWVMLPGLILFVIFSMALMRVIHDLRLNEVSLALRNTQNDSEEGTELLLQRFLMYAGKPPVESAASYLQEGKLLLSLSEPGKNFTVTTSIPALEATGIGFINLFSTITGGERYTTRSEQRRAKLLHAAYIMERRRKYQEAISLYNRALTLGTPDAAEEAYIRLHRGFCLALSGDSKTAMSDLQIAAALEPESRQAVTAVTLLARLQSLTRKKKEVDSMPLSVKKGSNYFQIMAYTDAIGTLNELEKKDRSQALYFYRGRSYEETGQIKEAIADYRLAIAAGPTTELAKAANRRLFMIASFYEKNDTLKKEAAERAVKTRDTGFIEKAAVLEKADTSDKEEKFLQENTAVIAPPKSPSAVTESESLPVTPRENDIIEERTEPPLISEPPLTKSEIKPPITETERLFKKLDKATTQNRQKTFQQNFVELDVIETFDGAKYTGAIKEKTDSVIIITTLYNNVEIPISDIKSQYKVATKEVLR